MKRIEEKKKCIDAYFNYVIFVDTKNILMKNCVNIFMCRKRKLIIKTGCNMLNQYKLS